MAIPIDKFLAKSLGRSRINGSVNRTQTVDDATNRYSALGHSLPRKSFDVDLNIKPTERQIGIANAIETFELKERTMNKPTRAHARTQIKATKSAKQSLLSVVSSLSTIF